MLYWNNVTNLWQKKRTKQSQHFLKTWAFGHPFRLLGAVQPFLKFDRFNMAHSLLPISNEFRTNVNIPYIFCCQSRALITLTGSFNWLNYTKNPPCATYRRWSSLTVQNRNKTKPRPTFLLLTSVHFLTVHYILINAYQHVLRNPFTSESEVAILHRSATHQAFEANIYLK